MNSQPYYQCRYLLHIFKYCYDINVKPQIDGKFYTNRNNNKKAKNKQNAAVKTALQKYSAAEKHWENVENYE